MPKKTAQEVMNDVLSVNVNENSLSVAGKLIDYAKNVSDINAADDTELDGLKQTIQSYIKTNENSKHLSNASAVTLFNLNSGLLSAGIDLKIEAGHKLDDIKNRIRQGRITGTEFLLEDELEERDVNKLANSIFVAENPELAKKIKGYELLAALIKEQLREHTCDISEKSPDNPQQEVLKVVDFNGLSEQWNVSNTAHLVEIKYPDLDKHNADEYLAITGEDLTIEPVAGFKVNPEYQPNTEGSELFSELPVNIEDYIACTTREDYIEQREQAENKKDICGKYIANAKTLAANARAMLEELKNIERTDGKEDSQEYTDMFNALESLSNLDKPTITAENEVQEPQYVPAEVLDTIQMLSDAADAYHKKNDAIYKKHEFGKDRLNMSIRLKNLCTIAKPIMEPADYKFGKFVAVTDMIAEENEKIQRLERAREKKGFEPFEPHKPKEPTIAQMIARAKRDARNASANVKGGSKEFENAVNSFDKLKEIYTKFKELDENTELDTNKRRTELSKLTKELKGCKEELDKYIARKRQKGQMQNGSTVDLKSQMRINVIKMGYGIINKIKQDVDIDAMYRKWELEDDGLEAQDAAKMIADNENIKQLDKTNKVMAIQSIKQSAKNEAEGSYMRLVGNYSEQALLKLHNIAKNNPQAPLTPEDQQNALSAMAVISYYDLLKGLNKEQINAANNATDRVLRDHLNTFRNTAEFKRALGDGTEITREQVDNFLADPAYAANKIRANLEKVNEINNIIRINPHAAPQGNVVENNRNLAP